MSEKIRELYRKAGQSPPKGNKGIHTLAFHKCVVDVSKKGNVDNPHAVCMASLGRNKAVHASHRK
jgi:hypothetical protein